MRYNGILAIIGITVVIVIVLLLYSARPSNVSKSSNEAYVIIDGIVITVEIADEPDERRHGLMFRESLPKDQGMLFVFDREDVYSFWMMNVRFSLDIIWIDSSGIVVHIERDVPQCFEICPSYRPKTPARYVLEVNSGFADDIGLKEGSFVDIVITND